MRRIKPHDAFIINFRDVNFKNKVKKYLNITSNEVTYGDIKNVTQLDVSSKMIRVASSYITNMEEIRYFDSLRELVCQNNQLTSLDISRNTVLEKLWCDDNQLTSLDISRNTVLDVLSCSDNQLTSLDISRNTVLDVLSCSDNQLTSLDISRNTVLNGLFCYDNQLTSLDIRGMRRVYVWMFNFSNTTLQTLKVHQNIKDYISIIDFKTAKGSNVTISTYNAPTGSTNYELICNNYAPRTGGGSCND